MVRLARWFVVPGFMLALAVSACGQGEAPIDTPGPTSTRAQPGTTPSASTPTAEPTPSEPEVPSGAVALFYRVNFGSTSESLRVPGGRVNWESSSKGIVRWIPETGDTTVLKAISSPSYSKSSIYPVTLGGKLYAYRDWGSDWAIDNERFDVDRLDPATGASLASGTISAGRFTVVGDSIYYRGPSGQTFYAREFEAASEQRLSWSPGGAIQPLGDRLLVADGTSLQVVDPTSGDVRATITIPARLAGRVWPTERSVFAGSDAVYVAMRATQDRLDIVRLSTTGGALRTLMSVPLAADDFDVVIDEDGGTLMVAVAGDAAPRGIAIRRVYLADVDGSGMREVPLGDRFIASSQQEAGGGLQVLVMP